MSRFKCNITYKKIEGDSLLSTQNKLRAHGFIDQYWNVKTDIATIREAKSELNNLAESKLGLEKVNLFEEKVLLNGIRLVPNIKYFSIIDRINKENIRDYQPQFARDEINENFESFQDEIQTPLQPIETRIYTSINQKKGSLIDSVLVNKVQTQIDEFNSLNTGKVLSLQEIKQDKFLIKTEFKSNYLYRNQPTELSEINNTAKTEVESMRNFNLPCIRNI